jgi:putative hydrolase of the HAD superfamily
MASLSGKLAKASLLGEGASGVPSPLGEKDRMRGSWQAGQVEECGVMGNPHAFAHVESWIFDLDDTLYPEAAGLHQQIGDRIIIFLADLMGSDLATAAKVRRYYRKRYGATLPALVQRHKLDPAAYLDFVHEIDLSCLSRDEAFVEALAALPGRRIVFTNGAARHAKAVLAALRIESLFEAVCHIEGRGFIGKPERQAYELLLEQHALEPKSAAIFDDREDNLVIPHELGMRTVLVVPPGGLDLSGTKPSHIDEITADLTGFLQRLPVCNGKKVETLSPD